MEIAFIFPSSLKSVGGVCNWAKEVIPRLYRRGISVKIYASEFIDGQATDITVNMLRKYNIAYTELPIKHLLKRLYITPFTKEGIRRLESELSTSDIIYIQNIFIGQDKQLLELMYKLKKPVIVGYHTPLFNNRFLHDLCVKVRLLNIWKKFSAHHVLTNEQKEILLSHNFKNVFLIPNGIDTRNFIPNFVKDNDVFKILFLGRLNKIKGINLLLEAARNLYAKGLTNIKFIIAGDGPLKVKVLDFATRYYNIEYRGFINEELKKELYRQAHVFVLPSKAEGFPLTILEAMASGCYIISSSDYGIVPKGNIILKELTVHALEKAIISSFHLFTKNKNLYYEIIKTNRYVIEKYDWDVVVEQLIQMFKEVYKIYV